MAYCGSNNMWQCGETDRTHPIGCNFSDTTGSDSSTFFMIEPTKLSKGPVLPSTEPQTTEAQYIPTQWGKPEAAISATTSPSITSVSISTITSSSSSPSSPSSSSGGGLSAAAYAGIAIAGLVVAVLTLWVAWKQLAHSKKSRSEF
jgi:hypothetical protein